MNTIITPDCDSKEALIEAATSLKNLNRLITDRKAAVNDTGVKLTNWLLMGRLVLDSCGNTMIFCNENIPIEIFPNMPTVLPLEEYGEFVRAFGTEDQQRCSYQLTVIPNVYNICPECGQVWNIENFFDNIRSIDKKTGRTVFRHRECFKKWLAKKTKKFFKKALIKAGFEEISLKETKNLYCPEIHCAPWYTVKADGITLTIGHRYRVISISTPDPRINFLTLFPDEDVTKDTNYIHAWGEEKCVEYLTRIKAALT